MKRKRHFQMKSSKRKFSKESNLNGKFVYLVYCNMFY
nr:MAG TPA: hypothetical protein [Crassvirales sp.]